MKYQVIYNIETNEIVSMKPFNSVFSDEVAYNIINDLNTIIDEINSRKQEISISIELPKKLDIVKNTLTDVSEMIKDVMVTFKSNASTSYTHNNIYVSTRDDIVEHLNSKNINHNIE